MNEWNLLVLRENLKEAAEPPVADVAQAVEGGPFPDPHLDVGYESYVRVELA
jgi:hypothetical protein